MPFSLQQAEFSCFEIVLFDFDLLPLLIAELPLDNGISNGDLSFIFSLRIFLSGLRYVALEIRVM